jgi:hypothetical protein
MCREDARVRPAPLAGGALVRYARGAPGLMEALPANDAGMPALFCLLLQLPFQTFNPVQQVQDQPD